MRKENVIRSKAKDILKSAKQLVVLVQLEEERKFKITGD